LCPTTAWRLSFGVMGRHRQIRTMVQDSYANDTPEQFGASDISNRTCLPSDDVRCFRPPTVSQARRRRRQRARTARKQCEPSSTPEKRSSQNVAPFGRSKKKEDFSDAPLDSTVEDTDHLDEEGENVAEMVEEFRGSVQQATFDAKGCRRLQLVFQSADRRDAEELIHELRGVVKKAICSPNGNYVIQKIIEVCPTSVSAFIIDELRGEALSVACHKFGCRVMQRLAEHSAQDPKTIALFDEVLQASRTLCRHSYGHFFAETLSEHGIEEHKHEIALALNSELCDGVMNRNVNHVVEAALKYCSFADQSLLVTTLLSKPEYILALAEDRVGLNVVRTLLRHPGDTAQEARTLLMQYTAQLHENSRGRRVLQDLMNANTKNC